MRSARRSMHAPNRRRLKGSPRSEHRARLRVDARAAQDLPFPSPDDDVARTRVLIDNMQGCDAGGAVVVQLEADERFGRSVRLARIEGVKRHGLVSRESESISANWAANGPFPDYRSSCWRHAAASLSYPTRRSCRSRAIWSWPCSAARLAVRTDSSAKACRLIGAVSRRPLRRQAGSDPVCLEASISLVKSQRPLHRPSASPAKALCAERPPSPSCGRLGPRQLARGDVGGSGRRFAVAGASSGPFGRDGMGCQKRRYWPVHR